MLRSPCHIIATMRAKQEYVLETNDKGKQTPKKVGLAPVQRDGMEYEFTVMLDIDMSHVASASKDRTSLFDGRYFKIDSGTGAELLAWLSTGAEVPAYNEDAMIELTAAIIDATTLEAVQGAFAKAYKYAKGFGNTDAMTAAQNVYNGRKAEFEPTQEPA
jgi:hypothetical protein